MPDTTCTTCEGRSADGVSRRSLLQAAGAGAALGAVGALAGPSAVTRVAFAGTTAAVTGPAADVLVVLSLRGGFDGLSAIVPAADPEYARLRPNVAVPASRLLAGTDRFGLHPALAPLHPFWQNGTFGAVHAVGQAAPSRSHFSAMAEMERAAPGSAVRTGWIDRLLGVTPATTMFRATQLGGVGMLGSLTGPNPELVVSTVDDFRLHSAWNSVEEKRWSTALSAMHRGSPAAITTPARSALVAMATTTRLKKAGYTPANGAAYPAGDLGTAMRDVARLIKAGTGLRIACIDYGEWDLHQGMGSVDDGLLTTRLGELASAMAAFATDLGAASMAGVTVVTLSEFGRRVAENGSGGTDHGLGNAVLMLGGGVVGGTVHGVWPGLAAADLVDGDLAATVDYRLVLGEIVQKRCLVPSLGAVFPGLRGAPLGVVRVKA